MRVPVGIARSAIVAGFHRSEGRCGDFYGAFHHSGDLIMTINRPWIRAVAIVVFGLANFFASGIASAIIYGDNGQPLDRYARYEFGLWGDLPYSDQQAQVGVSNLIADMNKNNLEFSVYNGNFKAPNGIAGSVTATTCSNALYAQVREASRTLASDAVLTFGENDWTNCDRPSNGAFNSLERLDYARRLFFATPPALGDGLRNLAVQDGKLCLGASGYTECVENRRWAIGGVVYVTLNIPGACNNLCDVAPNANEYAARNRANIEWMRSAFAYNKARSWAAMVIISHANPGWDQSDGTRAPLRDPKSLAQTDGQPDGYQEFLLALRDEVAAFERPVLYVHGGSHYPRIDKPLLDARGRRLENFTRAETFGGNPETGNNDAQWLKVIVEHNTREVFSFQPQIVPGNRTAVSVPPTPGPYDFID